MKRVAVLCLPNWPIDRLRQAERTAAPPDRARHRAAADVAPLTGTAIEERMNACSVPREAGFRPGARWARDARAAEIAALPAHQRPPMRELGRRSEPADHPFKAMPPDEAARPVAERDLLRDGRMFTHAPRGLPATSAAPARGERRRAAAAAAPAPEAPPCVTSLREGNRVTVAAACPAARALGIRPGMALTAARAQLPGLEVHPADPQGDAAALRRLAIRAARRWSPVVALAGDHALFLDLSGVAHLFGGEAAMARRIVRLLARRGITAHVAIADTAGAAWALAQHLPALVRTDRPPLRRVAMRGGTADAPILICPPGAHADAIAPLPPEALRIDPTAAELLRRLGVERIGTLAAMPRAPLVRRFGAALAQRLDQALGHAPEPLDPVVPPQLIAVTQRFAEPVLTGEGVAHWLAVLMPRLAEALAQAGRGARGIECVAERVDGAGQRLSVGLARASRDPAHMLQLMLRNIERIDPGFGIDAIHLHVRRSEPLGAIPFVERLDTDETAPDLAPLVDRIATRIGEARMWRAAAVESDVPERSVSHAGALDTQAPPAVQRRDGDVRALARAPLPPWHPRWPRPVRLLRRPEPVDDVLALLPDHPPRRFTWRGQSHRVVRADGPERVHGEWWRRAGEFHATRDYFRVEDEAGRRYWLFRHGDGEREVTGDMRWYLHGLFG